MCLSVMLSCHSSAKAVSQFTDNKPFSRSLFHTFYRGLFVSGCFSLLTSLGRNVGHEAKMLKLKTKTCFFIESNFRILSSFSGFISSF